MNDTPAAALLQEALTLHRRGDLAGAIERYERLLRDNPNHADALFYLAMAAYSQGRAADAVRLGERAVAAGRDDARLHDLLGSALRATGAREAALTSFDRAIALQPDFAIAHGNRANVLAELGRLDEAMAAFDLALKLDPASADDWCNRGAALAELDRFDEALASTDRALALNPSLAGAHYNRGNALRDLGQLADARGEDASARFDQALAAHGQAIALAPQYPDPHFGRALIHLLRGDWEGGWGEYEYRVHVGPPSFVPLPHPLWRGEPLPGQRLVLVAEQGLGDAIMYSRFAGLLVGRGFDVTLLVRSAMKPLLATLGGVKLATSPEELTRDPRPIRWLPLMSVAGALGITPATVPARVPYLAAEPARIDRWGEHLGTEGFKIGINWGAGHSGVRHFTKRNVPLAAFAPLAALSGVRLISLQKGDAAGDIASVDFRDKIETVDTDPNPDGDFFLDTAAVMTRLHLVVTCDTSVAHLAGALARPVFTALPAIADWRWLTGRDDSPWYPTMRLYRQRTLGDWSEVLSRVAEAVRQRIKK